MRSGRLRHKLTFLAPGGSGTDAYGQPVEDWTDPQIVAEVWADREAVSGREFYEGRAQLGKDVHRFRTRYRSSIDNRRYRFSHRDEVYRIEALDNVEDRDRELVITATLLEAGG